MSHSAQSAEISTIADIPSVLDQLERILLGKRTQLELAVACFLAQGHLLIEDIPGVGKTTLAQAIGQTFGLPWKRVQFTSDLLPADIVGVSIYNTGSGDFEFKPGPVFTSVLLADEINRAPPKAQSALLEAMEERQVSIDGVTHPLHDEFFVIATQNPADQLGTYPLPESQLDRFLVGIEIGYPDAATERELLEYGDRRTTIESLPVIANQRQLNQWISDAKKIHVAPPIYDYVQNLLQITRDQGNGLSPRAGLNLLSLSRAYASMKAREHVLPDDVQAVFPALAGHRLAGSVRSGQQMAAELLQQVPSP